MNFFANCSTLLNCFQHFLSIFHLFPSLGNSYGIQQMPTKTLNYAGLNLITPFQFYLYASNSIIFSTIIFHDCVLTMIFLMRFKSSLFFVQFHIDLASFLGHISKFFIKPILFSWFLAPRPI
jgi:hypothetical protein